MQQQYSFQSRRVKQVHAYRTQVHVRTSSKRATNKQDETTKHRAGEAQQSGAVKRSTT